MRVIVSLDKLREAEDLTRKATEWDAVSRGLRALVRARAPVSVLLVVTPPSAPFLFRAVTWLWRLGVAQVGASIADTTWTVEDRAELRRELAAVGRMMLRRRLSGEEGVFEPFLGVRDGADWWRHTCTQLGQAVIHGVAAAERMPRTPRRRRAWVLPVVAAGALA